MIQIKHINALKTVFTSEFASFGSMSMMEWNLIDSDQF